MPLFQTPSPPLPPFQVRLHLTPPPVAPIIVEAPPPSDLRRVARMAQLVTAWRPPVLSPAVTGRVRAFRQQVSTPGLPVNPPTWQEIAVGSALGNQFSGEYTPILYVHLPQTASLAALEWNTAPFDDTTGLTPVLARLDAGGVGTLTRDLDELTDQLRLGGASFTLLNYRQTSVAFVVQDLARRKVRFEVGWNVPTAPMRQVVFRGIVERWEIREEDVVVSCVPATRRDHRPLSLSVREVAFLDGFLNCFPELPAASADLRVPLYLGPATAVPLIAVGNNTYLTGFGVTHVSAVRDNLEEVLFHGERPLFFLYPKDVHGDQLLVVKMRYQVAAGHNISIDINQDPFDFPPLGYQEPWSPSALQPYDFTPRPRHNLFTNGSFENGAMAPVQLNAATAAVVEVVAFPAGAGKLHHGTRALRMRSTNTTDTGEHRYTAQIQLNAFQEGATSFHFSFWYIAGTFLQAGQLLTEQVSSQLSVQLNGDVWTQLRGSQGFDQMAEYRADIVVPTGYLDLKIKGEGLTETASVDIYLDDFVCYADDPVRPFVDQGVHPVDALATLFSTWLPEAQVNSGLFTYVRGLRPQWLFVSIFANATDLLALMLTIAAQMGCALHQDVGTGAYRLDPIDGDYATLDTYTPLNIVPGSVQRLAAPQTTIYSGVQVQYSQEGGIVFLSSLGTNVEGNTAALLTEAQRRAGILGGDHLLQVDSSLLLDRYTATQRLLQVFARYGLRGDTVRWHTWLDALTVPLFNSVTVDQAVVSAVPALVDLTGWQFLPSLMQVELTGRARVPAVVAMDVSSAPIAHPISLTTQPGVPVGVSILLYVTPAPGTTLDLASILVFDLLPVTSGAFAISAAGVVVFTPAPGFTGFATARYTIEDLDNQISNISTISITVGTPVLLVVANPDVATTLLDTPVTFDLLENDIAVATGVLNVASVDLDPLGASERQITWEDVDHGTFVADDLGNVTLTPVVGYVGDAVALYAVADNQGNLSNPTTITVHVVSAYGWTLLQTLLERSEEVTNTGIHVINAFAFFSGDIQRLVAVTGDPRAVGGTGFVDPPGPNDVYSSSRLLARPLGGSEEFGRTRLAGTLLTTTSGNSTTALVNAQYYGQDVYVAFNTADQGDDEVNAGPVIFSIINLIDYEQDTFASTWIEEHEFATTFARVGAMLVYDTRLYVALEPTVPGTGTLDIWTYDNATWEFQATLGTGVSRLRSFVVFAGVLYGGADGKLYTTTGGAWTLAETFTGVIDALAVPVDDDILYINVLNGTDREIWTTTNGTDYTLLHTFTNETSELPGVMAIGPDGALLYVSIREGVDTRVYAYDGADWAISRDWGDEFLGMSALYPASDSRLYAALARRWHAVGNVDFLPDAEIWYLESTVP